MFPYFDTCLPNTTTSLMDSTPAKLAKNGITANTHTTISTKKLVFYCNLFIIFTTNHHFCLLHISLQPF